MVPDETQVLVPEQTMRTAVEAMFVCIGMPRPAAAECTDVLIASDLRGNESHGVSNMLREYINGFLRGRPLRGYRIGGPIYDCNPRPVFKIIRDRPATAVVDADGALGIQVGPHAMRMAIAKAKAVGVGTVVVRNAGHFGAIGYFAKMAAEAGCIGQVQLSSGGNMPPTFGGAPRLGTNPVAWAAPAGTETPLMLDMATTQVAGNKLSLATRLGVALPSNWITEPDGTIISEEVEPTDLRTAMLLPVGGTRENGSHKGYGMAVVNELMAHGLSSTDRHHVLPVSSPERVPIDGERKSTHGALNACFFCAWDVQSFADEDDFTTAADNLLSSLKETPPAPGHERVLYPGLRGAELTAERRARGIPYHPEVSHCKSGGAQRAYMLLATDISTNRVKDCVEHF
eukprot:SAG11_NODE_1456_length_4876_cov_20.700021_1_plen_400_part_00